MAGHAGISFALHPVLNQQATMDRPHRTSQASSANSSSTSGKAPYSASVAPVTSGGASAAGSRPSSARSRIGRLWQASQLIAFAAGVVALATAAALAVGAPKPEHTAVQFLNGTFGADQQADYGVRPDQRIRPQRAGVEYSGR